MSVHLFTVGPHPFRVLQGTGTPVELNIGGVSGGAVDSVNGETGVVVLSAADVGAATAAQGATADTAVQPGDLATVATTGAYADLSGKPTLGTAAAAATGDFATAAQGALADTAVQPAALAGYQPVDSDLTAIAALATTAYGRAFLALADQAALTALVAAGNETSAGKLELATNAETVTGTDTTRATHPAGVKAAVDAAVAAVINSAPGALDTLDELAAALGDDANYAATITAALATKQPLDADLTSIAALTTTSYGRALLELANQAALVALLPSYQPLDSDLTAIAALTTSAYGRGFLDLADAAAARTKLALGTAATTASGDYATAAQGATADAAVPKALYDANTILAATTDNTPTALTVAASRIVGRKATGDIAAMTLAELVALGGTPDGTKFLKDDGTLATPSGGGGSPYHGAVAPLSRSTTDAILPGRVLRWGGNLTWTVGRVLMIPFYVVEAVGVDAYIIRVETPQASGLIDLACYSVANWKLGSTATKVSGTGVTAVNISTNGFKTGTLAAPVTLAEGCYWLAGVAYGSASNPVVWGLNDPGAFLGADLVAGTQAVLAGITQTVGASSLDASYTVANVAALGNNAAFATLRRT